MLQVLECLHEASSRGSISSESQELQHILTRPHMMVSKKGFWLDRVNLNADSINLYYKIK